MENKILIERNFDASIELVWKCWTDPMLLRRWFGSDPYGSVQKVEMDLKIGGQYKITFSDSGQTSHTCSGVFLDIIEFKRLVYSWEWASEPGYVTEVWVNFESKQNKTYVTLEHKHLNPASKHTYAEGWNSSLTKMGNILHTIKHSNMEINKTEYVKDLTNKKLYVTRIFEAPLELVWRTWTESELLDQWWAPKPWRTETKSLNFSVGGSWLYSMVGPEGERHWCKVEFKNINLHKSFETADFFCDEYGVKNNDFPVMEWKNVFTATGEQTLVKVEVSFTSVEDLEKIVSMGFQEGFAAAHTNLDELLQKETA